MPQSSNTKSEITIFISSPGDVSAERMIADRVLRKLQKEYAKFTAIRPIIWENLPLTSTQTFQDGINAVLEEKEVDIAVFILGNRLGSSPGNNYRRPDGTPYQSGTEYEYDFMLHLHEISGRPEILVYRKLTSDQTLLERYHNLDEAQEATRQNNLLKDFIQEHFEDKQLGAYLAYHKIDETINFESRLTEHLRGLLQKLLNNPTIPKYNGNPYRGLLAFQKEDEEIYFGREHEVQQLEAEILNFISRKDELPTVFICGASGTGKSSLVNAGLIPDLLSTGLKSGGICRVERFSPQLFNGNFFAGFLDLLSSIIPELHGDTFFESLYSLSQPNIQDMSVIDKAIERKTGNNGSFTPVVVIDQFEEFFTDARLTPTERSKSILLLRALQQTGKLLMIFTLRSDFYQKLTSDTILLDIKRDAIVWDIPLFSPSELREIIEEPARMTGIQWEKTADEGLALNDRILDDAIQLQSLPLLEFALTALYEQRQGNVISYKAYQNYGGLSGAIENYATQVFNSFNKRQQKIFFQMLGMFITISDDGKNSNRKDVILDNYSLSIEQKQVLDILVSRRLFNMSRNSNGQAVCTIAHEFLINHWGVVVNWQQRERELLERCKHFEMAEARWHEHQKKREYITVNETEVAEAEDLLLCWEDRLPTNLLEYLSALIKKNSSRWRWTQSVFLSVWILLMFIGFLASGFIVLTTKYRDILSFDNQDYISFMETLGIEYDLLADPTVYLLLFFYTILGVFFLWRKWYYHPQYKKDNISLKFYIFCFILLILLFILDDFSSGLNIIITIIHFTFILSCIIYTYTRIRRNKLRRLGKLAFNPQHKVTQYFFLLFHGLIILIFLVSLLSGYLYQFVSMQEKIEELDKNTEKLNNDIQRLYNWIPDFDSNQLLLLRDLEEKIKQFQKDNPSKPIPRDLNFSYARTCYFLFMSNQACKYGFGEKLDKDEEKELMYYIAKDMGIDYEQTMLTIAYECSFITPWVKVWHALKSGDINKAQELAAKLVPPDSDQASPELLNYAHYILLVKQDIENSLLIYQKHLGYTFTDNRKWNNELLYDFAYLKQHAKFRATITKIESQLDLKPILISFAPRLDVNKDLPQLIGNWILVNKEVNTSLTKDMEVIVSITSNMIHSDYIIKTETHNKCFYRKFSRTKITPLPDNNYLWEETNPRDDSISVAILSFPEDNTLILEIQFYNGDANAVNTKLIYKKITQ